MLNEQDRNPAAAVESTRRRRVQRNEANVRLGSLRSASLRLVTSFEANLPAVGSYYERKRLFGRRHVRLKKKCATLNDESAISVATVAAGLLGSSAPGGRMQRRRPVQRKEAIVRWREFGFKSNYFKSNYLPIALATPADTAVRYS
ncbi:hypothetical protein DFH06DRAFT_1124874 [Mycena polygramma]|nr:hypothetical protein DFH06DRAFT_1124874 [Mycena polygramma]